MSVLNCVHECCKYLCMAGHDASIWFFFFWMFIVRASSAQQALKRGAELWIAARAKTAFLALFSVAPIANKQNRVPCWMRAIERERWARSGAPGWRRGRLFTREELSLAGRGLKGGTPGAGAWESIQGRERGNRIESEPRYLCQLTSRQMNNMRFAT